MRINHSVFSRIDLNPLHCGMGSTGSYRSYEKLQKLQTQVKNEAPVFSDDEVVLPEDKIIRKIIIKDGERVIFNQVYDEGNTKEFEKILGIFKKQTIYSPVDALFVTPRMNTLKNFARDFFIPTTANYTSTIDNTFLKCITSIFSAALDIITIPVRLLTSPFRAIVLKFSAKNDLYKILQKSKQEIPDKLFMQAYKIEKCNCRVQGTMVYGGIYSVDIPESELYKEEPYAITTQEQNAREYRYRWINRGLFDRRG